MYFYIISMEVHTVILNDSQKIKSKDVIQMINGKGSKAYGTGNGNSNIPNLNVTNGVLIALDDQTSDVKIRCCALGFTPVRVSNAPGATAIQPFSDVTIDNTGDFIPILLTESNPTDEKVTNYQTRVIGKSFGKTGSNVPQKANKGEEFNLFLR